MSSAIAWLLASYLLGAIPTSYIVGRVFRGIDLREHGSRNLGATNLYRVLGWRFAVPVGLFDVLKGAVPVLAAGQARTAQPYFPIWCGVAAVVGHVFSIFVRFRGGKGVATAGGMVIALAPLAFPVILLVWVLVVWVSGYVSLGSIIAAVLFPMADWLLQPERRSAITLAVDIALAGFIVWKHRANIQRLLAGTENRFGRNARSPARGP